MKQYFKIEINFVMFIRFEDHKLNIYIEREFVYCVFNSISAEVLSVQILI
jgi:hypothetical protein